MANQIESKGLSFPQYLNKVLATKKLRGLKKFKSLSTSVECKSGLTMTNR